MRCAICDVRLPQGQRLEDDICSTCSHEIRLSLGMGTPFEEVSSLLPVNSFDRDTKI